MKKYLTWAIVAFALFYLLSDPQAAAGLVRSAAGGLSSAAGSLAAFVSALS
ncbi:MAG: hypothetical protein ACRDN9_00705 [Streptosporangiaceae bacterium]